MKTEITHLHFFCGSGAGALGFQRANVRVGQLEAAMRCLGGIDVDPGACRDFERFLGVPATCLDLFSAEQYKAFHGRSPPLTWREVTADDLRRAAGGESPNIVFTSAPCKGFSGLLNPTAAASGKYQALNGLTLRAVVLMLEAFADDLPDLFVFENVPRIAQRGRALLDSIIHELELSGYRVAETVHDCGELGGLAQHRRRFLLVARRADKIEPFLYEPPRHRVRGVGEVLGGLPMPDDARGGPMHRSPRLQWQTWLRLALIPAGGDWRSLAELDLDGLQVVPWHAGVLGVTPWGEPGPTVTAGGRATQGAFSVADPRPLSEWGGGGKYRVTRWSEAAGTVIGESGTGNGAFALADPRPPASVVERDGHVYGVTGWGDPAETITTQSEPGGGRFSVADPRWVKGLGDHAKMRVEGWGEPAHTITGSDRVGSGALSVADPRLLLTGGKQLGGSFATDGRYGVVGWASPSAAVTGHACQDNGAWSVADPRPLPSADWRGVPLIIALDGTWHRPFTTLELAVLQGYPSEELMDVPLDGTSDSGWRLHIGNAVPPPAAQAVGQVMAETILRARLGEVWRLDARPVWVRRLAAAVSVELPLLSEVSDVR